jgi:hypothetical protein
MVFLCFNLSDSAFCVFLDDSGSRIVHMDAKIFMGGWLVSLPCSLSSPILSFFLVVFRYIHADILVPCIQFSIVVRILKSVQDNEVNRRKDEARRQQDTQKLLEALESGKVPRSLEDGLPVSSSHKSLSCEENVGAVPSSSAVPALPPSEVIPALRTLQHTQNSHDAARDLEDLRCSMRAAMQTGSDVAVVEMMQVPREEMPEAMKTLQRALERVVERQECAVGLVEDVGGGVDSKGKEKEVEAAPLDPVAVESGSDWGMRDTLDREFIETGIEALRRLSEGLEAMPLPSWTITR